MFMKQIMTERSLDMFAQIKKDIDSIMLRDPAAKTRLEAALC